MQFFFATPQRLHRVHSHFFMVVLSMTEGVFLLPELFAALAVDMQSYLWRIRLRKAVCGRAWPARNALDGRRDKSQKSCTGAPAQPVSRQRPASLAGCVSCAERYFRYLTKILFFNRVFTDAVFKKRRARGKFLWPRWFIRADMKYLSAASVSKSSGASSMKQIYPF